MEWIKKLFNKKKLEDLPDLRVNENIFRIKQVDRKISQTKHIICNGEEIEIDWDQVIRFDQDGPGYKPTHYKSCRSRKPRMLVAHWDACLSTAQMIEVTKERGLSVHFGIDNDGTIYQLLDTKEIAWHAKGINTPSIGVEISNPVRIDFNKRYKLKEQPLRKVVISDSIHDKLLPPYLDFYPVQLKAFKALARAVCDAHDIPFVAPLDKEGNLVRGVDRRVQGRNFKGIVGHYHVTSEKTDPGRMPLDKIANDLAGEKK